MQIFKNRPLAMAMCLFALTALFAYRLGSAFKLVLLLLALLSLLFVLFYLFVKRKSLKRHARLILCLFGVLLAISSSFSFFNVRYSEFREKNGTPRTAEGYVLERLSYGAFYSGFRVHLTALDGEAVSVDAVLECDFSSSLQVGDRFVADAVQREFREDETFEEEIYRLSNGCLLILTCEGEGAYKILEEPSNAPAVLLSQWNQSLSYRLQSDVGEKNGLSAALLLGNRHWISADTELAFRRSGVSHLLALSGLHVSILIGFFELLFRLLHLPRVAKLLLMPSLAVFYLALVGFAVSTCRAVLMLCVLYCGFLLRRQYDSFTSLCTALTVILLVTPYAVMDISMWLSFLAAGSIIIFYPIVNTALQTWQDQTRLPKLLARALCNCIAAVSIGVITNLALLLLSAMLFGEVSLASVPATLLLSVPVTLLIVFSLILLCFPFLPLLPTGCAILERVILRIATFFGDIERVLLPMLDPFVYVILVLLAISLIVLAVMKIKRKRTFLIPVALGFLALSCAFLSAYLPLQSEPDLTVVQVSSGEARLYTQNGTAVLVREKRMLSGTYVIKLAALAENCTEMEDLIFYDVDNQATYFIASLASYMQIRTLHLPLPSTEKEEAIFKRVAQEAELHGIEVLYDAESFLDRYP